MSKNSVIQSDKTDNIPGALTPYDLIQWISSTSNKGAEESSVYDLLFSLPEILHNSISVALDVEKPRNLSECSTALRILSALYCKVEVAISQVQRDAESEAEVAHAVTH
ncbi:MAG: hypothetical protein ACYC1T_02785 [Sulfuricaulis sp.]